MQILTAEQVSALAPDAASVKAGQGLANPGKWVSLGRDARSVWGECQGSGKVPYRTQADMGGPAFHCSCPSRKFPCKHGLGLLLLLAGNSARVAEAAPPAWVSEWIARRDAGAEKKAAKVDAEAAPTDPETVARREADRKKRAAEREDRVRTGMAELQTWLGDLARQGLAHVRQHQTVQFFDRMAARMIDAQAPGIARRIGRWPGIFMSHDGWADGVLTEMGLLQLLIHGFNHLETLPDGMRASVRNAIGWTVTEQDLANAEAVRDRWQVVGQVVEEWEKLRTQRTWLIGVESRRPALCLSFAAANQSLDLSLVEGMLLDATLAYYPSGAPLRALVRERHGEAQPLNTSNGHATFADALGETANLLAGDPWIEITPFLVCDCLPMKVGDGWILRDATGAAMPMSYMYWHPWPLLAISGGTPVTVFCEWDGCLLYPRSAVAFGKFHSFRSVVS